MKESTKGQKILIFDDDPGSLILIQSIVQTNHPGVVVESFTPGKEALATCLSEHPALIFLDVFSTGIHGMELCRHIKASALLSDIPLIALTEDIDGFDPGIRALEAGADGCLKKPLIPRQCEAMLKMCLRLHTLENAIHLSHKDLLCRMEAMEAELQDLRLKQNRSEDALRIEQDFANQVLNAMGHALTITNSDGCFQYGNPAFYKLLGYEPYETLGKKPYDFTVEEDHHLLKLARESRMRGQTNTYETRVRHKSGKIIDVMVTGVPFYRSGQITGTIAVLTDISMIKTTEKRLKKLSFEYEQIFNGTREAMFLVKVISNNSFQYIRTNLVHQELTGISLEMLAGRTPEELLGKETGALVSANYARSIAAGKPILYDEKIKLPAGEEWWRTSLTPIFEDGKAVFIVGSSRKLIND